jgi:hypothetical protein
MKSYRFLAALSLAAAVCASAAAAYDHVAGYCVSAYRVVRDKLGHFLGHALNLMAPQATEVTAPEVRQVQAKAFKARIEKRERPTITHSWRMCPST